MMRRAVASHETVDLLAGRRWRSGDTDAERDRPDGLVQISRVDDNVTQDVGAALQLGHLGEQCLSAVGGGQYQVVLGTGAEVQQLNLAGREQDRLGEPQLGHWRRLSENRTRRPGLESMNAACAATRRTPAG